MMPKATERIDLEMQEIESLLAEAREALGEESYYKLEKLVHAYLTMSRLIEDKRTTIKHLRKLFFGSTSEKTSKVAGPAAGKPGGQSDAPDKPDKKKRKGHGRHGADAYQGAKKIVVPHENLKPGDDCPECEKGTVYEQNRPAVIVRITGQAPLGATVHELQRLRCNLCGVVFTAKAPEGIGDKKYDARSAAMIALLKYGSGLPFNRLQGLQGSMGIPLPASTQWDIVKEAAGELGPVYTSLIHQAAQGEVLYNDDTTMKILELMPGAKAPAAGPPAFEDVPPERTGVFTSGIVSTGDGHKVALFFTGRRHAGENLQQVLGHREAELGAPIQMCDALSRNLPGELEVILASCIAHGRRKFVDVVENFPDACRHVLEELAEIYRNDAAAREQGLSPEERLQFHEEHSGPVMDKLHKWFHAQFEEKNVEPNSGLGKAIAYMVKHWKKLTLFLRVAGAPLDNNICERALKKAILHRKAALFYKTQNGARVGDLFMSLVYTCQLMKENPFDYLTTLLDNATTIATHPQDWMPWNYRDTLAEIETA